jgi:hypothetical protein
MNPVLRNQADKVADVRTSQPHSLAAPAMSLPISFVSSASMSGGYKSDS